MTFAIVIIIVAFLPLFSLQGLEGKLFKPMASTIVLAMVGSLVLSLTLIPVLALLLLKPGEQRERGLTIREAVVLGTLLRLRPVLMTASVAIHGLLPMLLSSEVGAESQRPLATVVGGLLSATLLTLVLLPVVYEWMETRTERKAQE